MNEFLSRKARKAAEALADETEWAPAGQMLRVAMILENGEMPRVALPFALNARADMLNRSSLRIVDDLIAFLENSTRPDGPVLREGV